MVYSTVPSSSLSHECFLTETQHSSSLMALYCCLFTQIAIAKKSSWNSIIIEHVDCVMRSMMRPLCWPSPAVANVLGHCSGHIDIMTNIRNTAIYIHGCMYTQWKWCAQCIIHPCMNYNTTMKYPTCTCVTAHNIMCTHVNVRECMVALSLGHSHIDFQCCTLCLNNTFCCCCCVMIWL